MNNLKLFGCVIFFLNVGSMAGVAAFRDMPPDWPTFPLAIWRSIGALSGMAVWLEISRYLAKDQKS